MTETPSKGSILLIDDDKFLADMYGMKFTQQGYSVHTCLSVRDGLATLRAGFAADALVFDLIMPEMDGFAFLENVAKEKLAPHAKKIALTNQNDDAERARAKDLGADLFLVKATLIPSEVVNMVGQAMGVPKA